MFSVQTGENIPEIIVSAEDSMDAVIAEAINGLHMSPWT